MLSKIFKLSAKFVSELFGALILTATVFGMFYTGFLNEGILRIIGPLIVLASGIGVYVAIIYLTNKCEKNSEKSRNY